jgi:hypothetical protein
MCFNKPVDKTAVKNAENPLLKVFFNPHRACVKPTETPAEKAEKATWHVVVNKPIRRWV